MYASTRRVVEGKESRVVMDSGRAGRQRPISKNNAAVASEDGPDLFERRFWPLACGVALVWLLVRVFDFTLLPPTYKGLVITQPFYGLHSWDFADRAWAARNLIKYGLGYTKGLRTLVVGDPPPLTPEYYVSHPPLETWILALGMLVFGTQDWSVRLFELVLSVPCLFLILLLLRKLHDSRCALLSGLILVLLPYSGYFGFSPLMVLLGLWALYRYLLLTGPSSDGPAARSRYLLELGVALFLIVQYNWIGTFYAFTIGLHYVLICLIQRKVGWPILAAAALPSFASLSLNFGIMIWGTQHNIALESASPDSVFFASSKHDTAWQRMATLFQPTARTGKRSSFSWSNWGRENLEHAQANFTPPVLVFLAVYLLYLLIARVHAMKGRLVSSVQAAAQGGTGVTPTLNTFLSWTDGWGESQVRRPSPGESVSKEGWYAARSRQPGAGNRRRGHGPQPRPSKSLPICCGEGNGPRRRNGVVVHVEHVGPACQ